MARYVLGQKRGSRCATARLDRSIYDYSAACYYETIYIQGGNLLDRRPGQMGSAAFWPALRGYVAANRYRIVRTSTLLDALDAATPIDLGADAVRAALPAAVLTPRPTRPDYPRIRRSAASAFGIWRNDAGRIGRHARQPATSQADTSRSRTPQRRP